MSNVNPVSIDELRSNLADIINRVTYAKDKVVVKKHNREVALIISLDEYEKIMDPTKRLTDPEWQQHFQKLDVLRAKMPEVASQELDKVIDEELTALRSEQKSKSE